MYISAECGANLPRRQERPLCSVIKGVVAAGERRKRLEKQKKGKKGRGREGKEKGRKGSPAGPHLDPEQRQDEHVERSVALR